MEYVDLGGNDLDFLYGRCENTSPIIEECIIKVAAIIDQRIVVSENKHPNMYCVEKLVLDLVKMGIDSAMVDAVASALLLDPAADALVFLILDGLDIYTIYKMGLDYNNCKIGHIS